MVCILLLDFTCTALLSYCSPNLVLTCTCSTIILWVYADFSPCRGYRVYAAAYINRALLQQQKQELQH